MNCHSPWSLAVATIFVIGLTSGAGAEKQGASGNHRRDPEAKSVAYFHIAGFKGTGYSVIIKGSTVKYRSGRGRREETTPWQRVRVSADDLRRFWERGTDLGVFGWQAEYDCPRTYDGVWWSVDLEWEGRRLSSRGANKFPPRFDDLQQLIADLLHRPFGMPMKGAWQPCPS
jgi:hypothetical protein